jgi:signal peptidase I
MKYLPRLTRKRVVIAVLAVTALLLPPAYLRAYTLSGSSDAPTLLLGDWVLVNLASYDIRFPFSERVLVARADPQRGDLVLVEWPGDGRLIFKRVVAVPGDRVGMSDYHLRLNGAPCGYVPGDAAAYVAVASENHLGSRIEVETLGDVEHLIAYSREAESGGSFAEVLVPPGQYYLLGDNRSNSLDSRAWGPVSRGSIRGRVVLAPSRR